jgi:hypothetical protein
VRAATRQLATLVAADLLLLWVAASAARRKGLLLFVGGAVALAFALARHHRGRPRALLGGSFALLLGAVTVLGLEVVLALWPGLLRGRLANHVFNEYHAGRTGIYRADPVLGVAFKPGLRKRIYWNGHWWTHEANADGYRGPAPARPGAVFLGDSMIYGHGVETAETVAAGFTRQTGLPAANLGVQGYCLVQSLALLRQKGTALRPRWIFVASHPTDVPDVLHWYERVEIERFLAEDGHLPLVRPELRPRPPGLFEWWEQQGALPLRAGRLLGGLARAARDTSAGPQVPSTAEPYYKPAPSDLDAPFAAARPDASADDRLAWDVHRRALSEIKRAADLAGARMVMFDLGYPREFSRAIEGVAQQVGVAYSPAGRVVLAEALRGEPMYLANDGHWTPAGCARIARELAASVEGAAAR